MKQITNLMALFCVLFLVGCGDNWEDHPISGFTEADDIKILEHLNDVKICIENPTEKQGCFYDGINGPGSGLLSKDLERARAMNQGLTTKEYLEVMGRVLSMPQFAELSKNVEKAYKAKKAKKAPLLSKLLSKKEAAKKAHNEAKAASSKAWHVNRDKKNATTATADALKKAKEAEAITKENLEQADEAIDNLWKEAEQRLDAFMRGN